MNNLYHSLIAVALLLPSIPIHAQLQAERLQVNGLSAPLGIDRTPVFSWQSSSDSRGFIQQSYSITVTNAQGQEVWSTGTVPSSNQTGITYAGEPLQPQSAYTWHLQLTGTDGQTAEATSTFETAYLDPSAWRASWIAADQQPNAVFQVSWETPVQARYIKIDATRLGLPASTDNTGYYMQFAEVTVNDGTTSLPYTATANSVMNWGELWNLSYLNDGIVNRSVHLGYTTAKFTSADQHVWLLLDLGSVRTVSSLTLYPRQDDYGNNAPTTVANFPADFTVSASTDNSTFTQLAAYTDEQPAYTDNSARVPYFARHIDVEGTPLKRARLFVTALGVYSLRINGQPVSDAKLEPGESEYDKTLLYNVFDVTSLLRQGTNTLVAQVAGGLYNVAKINGRYSKGEIKNAGQTALSAELLLEHEDGTVERVLTDSSWLTTPSPITATNWWGGEDYDARLELPTIDSTDVDLSGWTPVKTITPSWSSSQASGFGSLKSRDYEPVKVVETWPAVAVNHTTSGGYSLEVVDFGRNFAGQYRFRLKGKPGQTITLRAGESLNADGSVFMENYYTGPSDTYDTYTFKGSGEEEVWGPELMYHGFRYLQIIGLDSTPDPKAFTAMRLRSNVENYGQLETDNTLINQIHVICRDAIASQLFNTITDCPQREKLGWLDVPNEMFNSLTYNFDMKTFFHKVVLDCFDAQLSDGHVPSTVPHYMSVYDNDPNWGGAAIFVPYRSWKTYGDRFLMSNYYDQMKELMDYYTSQTTDDLMNGSISVLSDWGQETAGVSPLVSSEFTINTTYYALLGCMAEMADSLGHTADAEGFRQQMAATRQAFNEKYYGNVSDGVYGNGQQSELAMPVYYGLADSTVCQSLADKLAERVKADNYKIKTGEIALKPLFMTLAKYGHNDIVYQMANETDCPSYGYWVVNGYTTTPEYWNVGAFSQNHCMMDHIEEWFFSQLAGITNAGEGFRHIAIAPWIPSDMNQLKASTRTSYGEVAVAYSRSDSATTYSITIPANSYATVTLPVGSLELHENGEALTAGANGINQLSYQDGYAHLELGSGSYTFSTASSSNPTAISNITDDTSSSPIYSITGMALSSPQPGINISNGKKWVVSASR